MFNEVVVDLRVMAGSLSAIVAGNTSGMERKGVDPKVEEDMKVKMGEENRNGTGFYKILFPFKYYAPAGCHEVSVSFSCFSSRIRDG